MATWASCQSQGESHTNLDQHGIVGHGRVLRTRRKRLNMRSDEPNMHHYIYHHVLSAVKETLPRSISISIPFIDDSKDTFGWP